jgi:hypothetical protein
MRGSVVRLQAEIERVPPECRFIPDMPSYSPLYAAPCRDLPHRERNLLIFLIVPGIS